MDKVQITRVQSSRQTWAQVSVSSEVRCWHNSKLVFYLHLSFAILQCRICVFSFRWPERVAMTDTMARQLLAHRQRINEISIIGVKYVAFIYYYWLFYLMLSTKKSNVLLLTIAVWLDPVLPPTRHPDHTRVDLWQVQHLAICDNADMLCHYWVASGGSCSLIARNSWISLHHGKYGGTDNISVQLGVVLPKWCGHIYVVCYTFEFPTIPFSNDMSHVYSNSPISKVFALAMIFYMVWLKDLVLNRSSDAVTFYHK